MNVIQADQKFRDVVAKIARERLIERSAPHETCAQGQRMELKPKLSSRLADTKFASSSS